MLFVWFSAISLILVAFLYDFLKTNVRRRNKIFQKYVEYM
nr:MAG TPA: chitin synthase regulator [Bacteriophage sp.]